MRLKEFFIFFSVIVNMCHAQKIQNVDFTIRNGVLIATYDLTGSTAKAAYDMKLMVVTDSGNVDAYTLYGDVKYVTDGKGKQIEWRLSDDKVQLNGKVQVIIKIVAVHPTAIKGGPKCAFLSVLLPGLGDRYVNPGNNYGYFVAAAYLTSVTYAIRHGFRTGNAYRAYHDATRQDDMDDAFEEASKNQRLSRVFFTASVFILAADVTYVTLKGFANRNKQLRELEEKSKKVHLTVSVAPRSFQFGFIRRF
jgi:hypothetical protein